MIKIRTTPIKDSSKKYPYVGKTDNDCVVLFCEPARGICLDSRIVSQIGKYSDDWTEERFSVVAKTTIESEI